MNYIEHADSRFWSLLHSITRRDDTREEMERATACCRWMAENTAAIRKTLPTAPCGILGIVWKYVKDNGLPPAIDVLSLDSDYADTLTRYKEHLQANELVCLSPIDLTANLKAMVPKTQAYYFQKRNKQASEILTAGKKGVVIESPLTGKEEVYFGADGARRLLREHLASEEAKDPFAATDPRIHAPADFRDDPEEALVELFEPHAEQVPMGIEGIDRTIRMSSGDLVGILGYSGSGKSRLGRTFSYNAAMEGRSVLHITTEQQRKPTRARYQIAHAWMVDPRKAEHFGINFYGWEKGLWSDAAKSFMRDVTYDLCNSRGGVTVVYPENRSWSGILDIVSLASQKRTYDAIFMDYLTHVLPAGSRNLREDMTRVIHEAQRLAATYDGGRGLVFMTPVQGNRKGYEDAQKNGGAWESTGVSDWSAFTQDCDVLFYVYQDEDLKYTNKIKVGTCKCREGSDLPATDLEVHPATQMFNEPQPQVDINAIMDDL